jgi:hypothetical protein
MKTDIYRFEGAVTDIDSITSLAESAAAYSGLDEKQTLRLDLLCEELVEMLPNLLIYGKGELWIEAKDKKFEIHTVVRADDLLSRKDRGDIIKVSSSGKNAAAVGIINKIRIAAETMFANYAVSGDAADTIASESMFDFYDMGLTDPFAQDDMWSLRNYKNNVKTDTAAWDELEKSVIAKLADDVTVGIIGGKVEITVKKAF